MITKLTLKDFPSDYLKAELESRNPNLVRGILRVMSTEEILLELKCRKSHAITIDNILKWIGINL